MQSEESQAIVYTRVRLLLPLVSDFEHTLNCQYMLRHLANGIIKLVSFFDGIYAVMSIMTACTQPGVGLHNAPQSCQRITEATCTENFVKSEVFGHVISSYDSKQTELQTYKHADLNTSHRNRGRSNEGR